MSLVDPLQPSPCSHHRQVEASQEGQRQAPRGQILVLNRKFWKAGATWKCLICAWGAVIAHSVCLRSGGAVLRQSLLQKRVFDQRPPWSLMTAWICLWESCPVSELNRREDVCSYALALWWMVLSLCHEPFYQVGKQGMSIKRSLKRHDRRSTRRPSVPWRRRGWNGVLESDSNVTNPAPALPKLLFFQLNYPLIQALPSAHPRGRETV